MRRRLTLLTAATMSLVLVAFLVPLALLLRDVAADRAVQSATTSAQSLAINAATTSREALALNVARVNADGRQVTVFLPDDTTVGAEAPRTEAVALAFAEQRSFSVAAPDGREIVFAAQDPAGAPVVIRAFVTAEEMSAGVTRAWLVLAGLGLALLVLGVAVADRLAGGLVRPLVGVAGVSHRLASGDLAARASPSGPGEVREVAAGLNHLAGRISVLLQEEREAVADLSHRLRTPLTALRLDAEALRDPSEAARVGADVDALERAVTQVIMEARATTTDAVPAGVCDAAAVIRERVAFWSVLAEDTGRALAVDLDPGPLPVRAARHDLEAAVDAILGNVFAHTDDGVAFAVRLDRFGTGQARLVVADEGSGFPGSVVSATERGASGAGSTGLGLDIARRMAETAGGGLALTRGADGGATVELVLDIATDRP